MAFLSSARAAALPGRPPGVGYRPQVAQLVRVDDRAHALDLALRDVEDHHEREHRSVSFISDEP